MRSVESLSLSILRLAEEHAMKENTGQVLVQAPTEIANYLLNEKRRALSEIEKSPRCADRHRRPTSSCIRHITKSRASARTSWARKPSKPSYHRSTPRKLPTHALTKAHLNIPDLAGRYQRQAGPAGAAARTARSRRELPSRRCRLTSASGGAHAFGRNRRPHPRLLPRQQAHHRRTDPSGTHAAGARAWRAR